MPVKVPKLLPAIKQLKEENIFVMDSDRALMQEIRPLKIALLNLMPNKETTETQIIRMIANSPLQVEIVLLHTETYEPKNTDSTHLESFYCTFSEVLEKGLKFDGLIITGAPVEKMDFSQVAYWEELRKILEWAKKNVYSSLYICWAAQAAMFYHYGINKRVVDEKIFGIFEHEVFNKNNPLVMGFDDVFNAPHSRYTDINSEEVFKNENLEVLANSKDAGLYLVSSKDLRQVFVFGHGEYDQDSLHNEYTRDIAKKLKIKKPKNYYYKGEVGNILPITWRASQSLLFSNWLNYCVYQGTPYDLESLDK